MDLPIVQINNDDDNISKMYLMCLVPIRDCAHYNQSSDIGTIRYVDEKPELSNLI